MTSLDFSPRNVCYWLKHLFIYMRNLVIIANYLRRTSHTNLELPHNEAKNGVIANSTSFPASWPVSLTLYWCSEHDFLWMDIVNLCICNLQFSTSPYAVLSHQEHPRQWFPKPRVTTVQGLWDAEQRTMSEGKAESKSSIFHPFCESEQLHLSSPPGWPHSAVRPTERLGTGWRSGIFSIFLYLQVGLLFPRIWQL